MTKRKEIVLDEQTEKDLEYLSELLDMNQSKVIKWAIRTLARAFGKIVEEVKEDD